MAGARSSWIRINIFDMSEPARKRILILVSSLASFLVPYTVSSLNVALPAIGESFGLDAVTLGWITSAYMLTAAIFIVPFGKLADLYGRKRFFLLGNFLFIIGSLLAAFAWSGTVIICARIIQALGGAMVFSTSIAIVTCVFQPGERGKAIGIITATVYVGLSLGPFIGGVLTRNAGWWSIFLLNIPIAIIVILLTLKYIPDEWEETGNRHFDLAGSVVYGVMLFGGIYGLTLLPSVAGVLWMALGIAGFVVFLWWERRAPVPIVELSLFKRNPVFLFSNVAALINYAVVFAVGFLLSLYLQFNRGIDPQTAGLILVAQPIVQVIISPISGHLSDRIEPRILATAGMGCTAAGLFCLMFVSPDTSLLYIIASLVMLGFGYGLFSSPNTNAIMSAVDVKYLGIASGMVSTMRAIGQMMSLAIVMLVFSAIIGAVPITPAVFPQLQQSVSVSFLVLFVISLAGIWTSYARGTVH